MAFNKKTVKDYDVEAKKVLLRTDYNIPLSENGEVVDDYRIVKSLDTINFLLDKNCSIVIIAHLGRPSGPGDSSCSLAPVAKRLSELLKKQVKFINDCIGEKVVEEISKMKPKEIVLLENLRFHPEEEANDPVFSKELAKNGQVFVQDGFGVVHRSHASTVGVTKFLPSISGLLLFNEVNIITDAMVKPKRPLMSIIGGAKIHDKIDLLKRFIDISDVVAVGGAMANTFLLANKVDIGSSLVDKADIELAKDILELAKTKASKQNFVFYIPQDGVVSDDLTKPSYTRIVDWSSHVVADIEAYPKTPKVYSYRIKENEEILDIGPFSGAFIAGSIQLASTVLWNGPLGVTETKALIGPTGPFSHGTELVVEALLGQFGVKPFSIIGGGDTVGYIESLKLQGSFGHVSTGGGASMELMSGRKLPGVEALLSA